MNALTPRFAGDRRRFLRDRLHVPASHAESLRIERVIAFSRCILVAIALVQLWSGSIRPASYAPVAFVLFSLFAAHSASALFVLRRRQQTSRAFALTTTVVDFLGAAGTLPLAAPASLFFAFFLFILVSSAFRWGFRETIAVTLVAVGLVALHETLDVARETSSLQVEDFVGRIAYLTIMGLVLGHLAEEARSSRAESTALASLLSRVRVDAGVARTVRTVTKDVVTIFDAARLLLIVEDRENHRLLAWDSRAGWSALPGGEDDGSCVVYSFIPPSLGVAIRRRGLRVPAWRIDAIDATGRQVDAHFDVPQALVERYRCSTVISVPLGFGNELAGRVFLFDPRVDARALALTQLLQTIVRQVGPAIVSVHLTRELHARAGAIERARVARELHDGVIQSLIGVEMGLDVLKRERQIRDMPAADELARLQQVVRTEVLNLRDLMQQMRPVEFDPHQLLDYLADRVQRFGRDTGIAARFITDLRDVRLPWRVCLEIVHIVQEGLVNVRKHSAATTVVVRFGVREGDWTIEIDDNGQGFPFVGQLSHADLENSWRGPIVIKERVRNLGGRISIDSTPGRGSRLEIRIPQGVHG